MAFPRGALRRARLIRLVSLDVDGVLTDGGITYGTGGGEQKTFNSRDGAAIKMLVHTGVRVAIVTGRTSAMVSRRADELGIEHLHQGVERKAEILEGLARELEIDPRRIAHVGDDIPDLGIFRRVGFPIAVANAHPVVMDAAAYVTRRPGGHGAVSEVCHLIMTAQGTWDDAVEALLT